MDAAAVDTAAFALDRGMARHWHDLGREAHMSREAGRRLSHREACYELASAARRLETGSLDRGGWFAAVDAILTRRGY